MPFNVARRAHRRSQRLLLGLGALCCALGVVGCAPSREPTESSRTVPISFPAQLLNSESPLRYAVVWTTASDVSSYYKDLVTVSEGPVDEDTFNVTFTYPQDLSAEFAPSEFLYFSTPDTLDVFRPRLVLYEDANGNRTFDPKVADAGPGDIVVALDPNSGPAITAIPKLREQLSALMPEQVQEYYASTGNRLIPFIITDGGLGNRYLSTAPAVLSLQPFGAAVGVEDLRCGRGATFGYFSTQRSIYLDENVADLPLSFCAQANTCQEADFATLPLDEDQLPVPPAESAEGTTQHDAGVSDAGTALDAGRRDAGGPKLDETSADAAPGVLPGNPVYTTTLQIQCRQRSGAVALVMLDPERTTCENCSCSSEQLSYVANPESLPAWWPCGEELPYCDGTVPLTDFDANCPTYELGAEK